MKAFYFLGITDAQDLMPILLDYLKAGEECWVCFFDCLEKKRQFYFYSKDELYSFISEVCNANKVSTPEISFFGQFDRNLYLDAYRKKKPEFVFLQNIFHKYPKWIPETSYSKVINLAWGSEEPLEKSYHDIFLNVGRYPGDLDIYKNKYPTINTRYFGNIRMSAFNHSHYCSYEKEIDADYPICFIPENHARPKDSGFSQWTKNVDNLITDLKNNGYKTVWKTREKGWPVVNKTSFLQYCDVKPDHVIKKDLSFPSSVLLLSKLSSACFVLNYSSVFKDIELVNDNCYMLLSKTDRAARKDLYDFFKTKKIIKLFEENGMKRLEEVVKKSKYNKLQNTPSFTSTASSDLIEFLSFNAE